MCVMKRDESPLYLLKALDIPVEDGQDPAKVLGRAMDQVAKLDGSFMESNFHLEGKDVLNVEIIPFHVPLQMQVPDGTFSKQQVRTSYKVKKQRSKSRADPLCRPAAETKDTTTNEIGTFTFDEIRRIIIKEIKTYKEEVKPKPDWNSVKNVSMV